MNKKNIKKFKLLIAKGNGELVDEIAREKGISRQRLFIDVINYKIAKDEEAQKQQK